MHIKTCKVYISLDHTKQLCEKEYFNKAGKKYKLFVKFGQIQDNFCQYKLP